MSRVAPLITLAGCLLVLPGCHWLYGLGPVTSGEASPAQAEANVRAAVPALEAYYADHGTYKGATPDLLRSLYDAGIPAVAIVSATDASYCVESSVDGVTYSKPGPAMAISEGPCGKAAVVPPPAEPAAIEALRVAAALMEGRHAQHGTFARVSAVELSRFAGYEIRIVHATRDRYCIEATAAGQTWSARETGDVGAGGCSR